jgi:hypothetical protein
MVSMLASSVVDIDFEPDRLKPIGICCFSTKLAALWRKSKDWLVWNQDNVSEWGDMSIRGLLFQCANTKNPTKHVCLVQSGPHYHLI